MKAASNIESDAENDIWACCIEQGIVSQLEYVCQGIPFATDQAIRNNNGNSNSSNGSSQLFPEHHIRSIAKYALESIASYLSRMETIRSRVLNAILHSGNRKLRLNILSGLLYSVGRCEESTPLGKLLWSCQGSGCSSCTSSSSTSSLTATLFSSPFDEVVDDIGMGGGIFHDLLTTLCRDLSELRTFLATLEHFLKSDIDNRQRSSNQDTKQQQQQQQQITESGSNNALVVVSIEPTVVIVDTDRVNRMKCPVSSLIRSHSSSLATLLEVSWIVSLHESIQSC